MIPYDDGSNSSENGGEGEGTSLRVQSYKSVWNHFRLKNDFFIRFTKNLFNSLTGVKLTVSWQDKNDSIFIKFSTRCFWISKHEFSVKIKNG